MKTLKEYISKTHNKYNHCLIADTYEKENFYSISFEYNVSDIVPTAKEYYMEMENLQEKIKDFCNNNNYKIQTAFCHNTVYYDFYKGE